MKLHSLRLTGFKTFGQDTQIAFNPGVSAIVGPNGSGKSNVVDAIAWVLGEQSPSLLRIKRASELVFQPANGSTAQNMASVELAIRDAHSALPTAGSEVTIARTGYRDGDSDFYLNGGRTLRKHIRALFAPYGMAQRTFSVIRQGNTALLLDVNPHNRLRVIQEAAGVLGLIQQKEEALRRLERTNEQLAPVRQELRELRLSVTHLERQARQFEQRQALLAELKTAMAPFYRHHFQHAAESRAAVGADLEKAGDRRRFLETACRNNRDLQAELRERYGQAAGQLEDLQDEIRQMEQGIQLNLRQRAVLEERQKQYRAQQAAAGQQQRKTRLQIQRNDADLERIQSELGVLETKLENEQQVADRKRARLEQFRTQRNRQTEQLKAARQQRAALDERLDVVSRELAQLHLDARLAAQSIKTQEEAERHWLLQCEQTAQQLQVLAARRREQDRKLEAARTAVVEARRLTREQEEKVAHLRQQRNRLDRRLAELTTRKSSWEEYLSVQMGRFAPVSAARPGEGRWMGILGSLLVVPPRYRKPVAACLGDWMHGMVFQSWDDACTVLKPGHETVQHDVIHVAALDRLPAAADRQERTPGLELLQTLIAYPEELELLLRVLLADCYVAPDAQTALRALDERQPCPPLRIVSLAGDLITSSGFIRLAGTGGADTQLLAMQHEVQILAADIQQAETALAETTRNLDLTTDALEASRQDQQQSQEQAVMAEMAVKQATQEWGEREKAGKRQRLQIEQARAECARLRKRASDLQAQEGRSQEGMAQLREEREAALQVSAQLEQALAAQDDESWSSELAAANLALQATTRETRHLQERQAQSARSQQALAAELQESLRQESALTAERDAVAAEVHSLTGQLDAASRSLHRQQTALAPLRQTTQKFMREQQRLDQSYEEQMAELRASEAQVQRLQFTLAQLKERETGLQAQLQADWELLSGEADDGADAARLLARVSDMLPSGAAKTEDILVTDDHLAKLRRKIARCGSAHEELYRDFQEAEARSSTLATQLADLVEAEGQLREIIQRLDEQLSRKTHHAFHEINRNFNEYFARFFPGGQGWLEMTDDQAGETPGVELFLQMPGKHVQHIAALSGGERAMAALAFICSMLKFNSPPFCVLDEIDAPLDETNVDRIGQTLRELAQRTQLILITHNHRMLEYTDAIWGVTLNGAGCSQVLSMRMDHSVQWMEAQAGPAGA